MEIIVRKISELMPYANNTRTHSDDQVTQIASSIKEFGFTNPVLLDEHSGIIAGHGRVMGAKLLKMDEVPTITLKNLTKTQIKAYVIADNRIALGAGWDEELLKIEIEALHDMDFDIELLGFDEEELEDLDIHFDDIPNDINEDKADDVPELTETPCIRGGDLIELGMNFQHRVLCGDSTLDEDVSKLMDGKKADMVFTDPPYGVSYQNNQTKVHEKIKNDDIFLEGWIPLVQKYSKGFIFVWTSYQVLGKWLQITEPFGKLSNMVVWSKGGGGLGDLKGAFLTDYELALVWNRKEKLKDKRIGSIWGINKDGAATYLHPTQKPVELMEKGIFNCSNRNNIIMDLFLGSGSTLIASENLTRKCYGMELDEKYVQVIVQRYCDYTNIDTIRINGVETSWEEYKLANTKA